MEKNLFSRLGWGI